MATVVVVAPDARLRARLRGALGRRHVVLESARWAPLPGLLLGRPVHVVAFAWDGASTPRGELRWLAHRHPGIGTVAMVASRADAREVLGLGRSGIDAVVLEGLNDGPLDLARLVERALVRALARELGARLEGRCDELLARCLQRAVLLGESDATAADLAEGEGVAVGSLRHALRTRGLPAPGRVLRWGRLILAAAALDREGRTVEQAAHALGYSTGAALSRALRREIGVSPTILRQRGWTCVTDALLARTARPPTWLRHPGAGSVGSSRHGHDGGLDPAS